MKLGDCDWWPKSWKTKNGQDIPSAQITKDGIFETCELLPTGLFFEIDYHGRAVSGRIGAPNLNAPNLERLRDFLLDYVGDSMTMVEDLDVKPDQFRTR